MIIELLKAWYDTSKLDGIPTELLGLVSAALGGSAEAVMRLPAELADIVRAARAQNAQPASASP